MITQEQVLQVFLEAPEHLSTWGETLPDSNINPAFSKRVYSCGAVHTTIMKPILDGRRADAAQAHELAKVCGRLVAFLGCNPGSLMAYQDIYDLVRRQEARALWLTWVALMLETETVVLRSSENICVWEFA